MLPNVHTKMVQSLEDLELFLDENKEHEILVEEEKILAKANLVFVEMTEFIESLEETLVEEK